MTVSLGELPRASPAEGDPAATAGGAATAADAAARKLTAGIASGDAGAFGAFYEAWFDRAYAWARTLTRRDESFCLDVVQEVMLRVIRALKPLPSERALAAWLHRVVHTTALDQLRRESRRVRREERASRRRARERGESTVPPDLEREERIAWLSARLAELPAVERSLLQERFERHETLDAAGRAAGMTGDAAAGRIRRAIARLRALAREVFHE
jgi:RNA polymerase sigma factor (sigma-70 family)